ncbi:MAG: amidohydrolase [Bacteroidales bacterium]|nr:amidohydrolase [Bacteroidales bacterium]
MKLLLLALLAVNMGGIKYLDSSFNVYDRMQKTVHEYAEPGFLEYKSSALLASHLEENGFSVEWGVAEIPTAFIASYGSGKPVIGILAEYDALPGLSQDTTAFNSPLAGKEYGHGCGHNLLGTGAVASAVAISKWLAEGHAGTVKLFGCPAEENAGAKAFMVRDGYFDGVDCVLAWHPSSVNMIQRNSAIARIGVVFTFKGKPAHSAGAPHLGRSALDAVEAFDYMMNLNREHFPPETKFHYVISNGGEAPNVVPAEAQAYYFLRHPSVKTLKEVLEWTKKAAEGAALGTGTTVECDVLSGNYPILINEHLSRMALKNLIKVGGVKLDDREKAFVDEVKRNSGSTSMGNFSKFETVRDYFGPIIATGGSDDVGDVSQVVPLFKVNTTVNVAGAHTWQMATLAGTTIGTKALINAAKVMYLTAVDLYTKPKELKAVRDEFESVRGANPHYEPLMGDRKPPIDFYTNQK